MKNKYLYAIAAMLGLLTCYFVYDYLREVEKASTIDYEEVVLVVGDVAPKSLIREEMLAVQRIPRDGIHPQAARKMEDVVGTITTAPLVKGEQILLNKVAKQGDPVNGLAYLVPPGKRAISMAVDDVSGVAGFIKPGDHVDIVGTINITENNKDLPYTFIVLQDIQVLAAGKFLDNKGDGKEPLEYHTVTLAVTPEEARPLVLTSQKGLIRMMLRSPIDNGVVRVGPINPGNLIR